MSEPTTETPSWNEANQHTLAAELAWVRELVRGADEPTVADVRARYEAARHALPSPSALDRLTQMFGLSEFERATLLLCAGVELESDFAQACVAAQGADTHALPTFSLALARLPEGHWSALTPNAPLRYWRLVELRPGAGLTTSPLRIDERVLHFLAGVPGPDERLAGICEPVAPEGAAAPPDAVAGIMREWSPAAGTALPVIELGGREPSGRRAAALEACTRLGLALFALPAERLPTAPTDVEALQRCWEREAALGGAALLLETAGSDASDPARAQAVRQWVEQSRAPLLVGGAEPLGGLRRATVRIDIARASVAEQRAYWERALGSAAAGLNGQLDQLLSQFYLNPSAIESAARQGLARAPDTTGADLGRSLWEACRARARVRLDELAQRLQSRVSWDDLVLPERTMELLRGVALHVRHRARVHETWGFAARSERGLGITAMFSGPSGTGKTLAAEVLAHELALDLYRIDLSQIVSKYIGETEKNLRRIFDAAEDGGAVLLFDEADALFGKRSEVKDSHDRYANLEVSYLLQRMEAYRGLAILTTNLKDSLDPAFLRRIRFSIPFPFPDVALRAEIWRRVFPAQTPRDPLEIAPLARLNLAGGNIRNVALQAAFLAADADQPVNMTHLLTAARAEYAKLDRAFTEAEWGKTR